MIKKRTKAVLIMLTIILLLILAFNILTISSEVITWASGEENYDWMDEEEPDIPAGALAFVCLLALILFLVGIGLFGLIIASGVVMIVSRSEYSQLQRTGLISGVLMLVAAGCILLFIFPIINILAIILMPVLFYAAIILYIYKISTFRGKVLLYISGTLIVLTLAVSIIVAGINIIQGDIDSPPAWAKTVIIINNLVTAISYVLLLISISSAKGFLHDLSPVPDGFRDLYGSSRGQSITPDGRDKRVISGTTTPPSLAWPYQTSSGDPHRSYFEGDREN